MTLLISALTLGLLLSLLALGVYVSFRVFRVPDITTDGAFALGPAVCAALLVEGVEPVTATLAGTLAGAVAGAITGLLTTRFRVNILLAGVLVMTALYSINLNVMGRSNVPLLQVRTLATYARDLGESAGRAKLFNIGVWEVSGSDLALLAGALLVVAIVGTGLHVFFTSRMGTAMRATGENPQMVRALGVDTGLMIVLGLALGNGLIALSGALLAQYQGFADVQMGIGMIVWGLASVIIGETLVNARGLGLAICGAVMGSLLFRLLIAVALMFGMNPNNLRLVTAVFVLAALVLPQAAGLRKRFLPKAASAGKAEGKEAARA